MYTFIYLEPLKLLFPYLPYPDGTLEMSFYAFIRLRAPQPNPHSRCPILDLTHEMSFYVLLAIKTHTLLLKYHFYAPPPRIK